MDSFNNFRIDRAHVPEIAVEKMNLEGKKVAVLGAGTSGFAACRLAASRGAVVFAFDSGDPEKLKPAFDLFAQNGIALATGRSALRAPSDLDYIIISPGISTDWEIAGIFASTGAELMGEIEFAWRLSGGVPVIGITGTNGKTTTTDLTASILNSVNISTVPCGNYGLAYSEVVLSDIAYDVMTIELSSFQLETISTFRPTVAVWMNFAPDHMDRYDSLDEYRKAKERIFECQDESDWCVVKHEDNKPVQGHYLSFSAFSDEADFHYKDGLIIGPNGKSIVNYRDSGLNGKHNAENVMAAMVAAHCIGVEYDEMVPAIMQYKPPAHRCEIVARKRGITFVNDSKSTNLHALESSLRGQETPVVLIVGGKKKGLDYSELNERVRNSVKSAICIGEMAAAIKDSWGAIIPCQVVNSLEEAVEQAWSVSSPGDTVLFSPGTSSFDMFSGYEERGTVFCNAVENLVGLK